MRNYRFKFTIALGIGAICGMLWTPVKLVHAEQQTSNIIAEAEADQEPAAGYVKIEENSSGPELYSDYDIAMYSTDSTTQSGTWGNISWSLSGTTLTISGSGDMPDADSSNKAPWITFNVEKVIIQRGITGIERFIQIMDADVEIFDEPDAKELVNPKGEIVFENVSFEYPDDHNKVFHNLNLTIHAGEKLAIVGPSGGGKTTLCNLIPRFYDVSGGTITLDGNNIRGLTLKSLRQNIGIVQQDVYLFSGTVYENIAYGKPGASREEVMEAARRAGADEFIRGLRDGYDTYVGERGVKLSGGQKQRISIARVFLKNPPIIILDEATSALDNESEYAVAKSLNELAKGRTTLTIAHRLSSIRNSDRILVLTDEGIVEEGNHDELMALGGIYHQFYMMANEIK